MWYSRMLLTQLGWVTCVGNLTIIGSDNGLLPGRHQAIIWTNAGILLNGPLGTNFSEILIEIHTFSLKKWVWKYHLRNGGHFISATVWKKMHSNITWYFKDHCRVSFGSWRKLTAVDSTALYCVILDHVKMELNFKIIVPVMAARVTCPVTVPFCMVGCYDDFRHDSKPLCRSWRALGCCWLPNGCHVTVGCQNGGAVCFMEVPWGGDPAG